MSDESLTSGLAQVASNALHEGRSVALRIEGDLEWHAIDRVNYGPHGPVILEVRRASDGHTLLIPARHVLAVDVGQS